MNFAFFLIVCGGLVLLVLQQQGKLPFVRQAALPPTARNIFNLEIGDIVQYNGDDWFVEGKLIYNSGAYSWFEYLLRDDDDIRWLSVEEDDIVEVSLLEEIDLTAINSSPPPQNITHNDIDYHLTGSGTASAMRLGNTLNRQAQNCEYYDYKSSSFHRLSVEIWHDEIEVTVGRKINPRMLNFLPGDGQKVYG